MEKGFRLKLRISILIFCIATTAPGLSQPASGFPGDIERATDSSDVIVILRESFEITAGNGSELSLRENSFTSEDFSMAYRPATRMKLDKSLFRVPPVSNSILNFGFFRIAELFDHHLWICGHHRNRKCKIAMMRTYTTGAWGPGIWNRHDHYGAPLFAGQDGKTLRRVGLGAKRAIVLQTVPIPRWKDSVKRSDFKNPKYNYKADFTDAGAGTFETTIVVEYGLSR